MSLRYLVLPSVLVFLFSASSVLAQAPSPKASPAAARDAQLQQKKQELRDRVATKPAVIVEDQRALKIQTIKAQFEVMSKRANAANERYAKFLDRVKSRRDKLEASGKNVTKLDALIKTATDNQTKAVASWSKLRDDLAKLDTTTNFKTAVATLRADMVSLKRSLQQLHASMKTVVSELKKLGGSASGRAPSSATTRK